MPSLDPEVLDDWHVPWAMKPTDNRHTLDHEVAYDSVDDAALVATVVSFEGGAVSGQADEVVDRARGDVSKEADLHSADGPVSNVDVKVDLLGDPLSSACLKMQEE